MDETRPGRRPGMALIGALAALVVLLVAALLFVVLRTGDDRPAAAGDVPDAASTPRGPGQVTADLKPTSGFVPSLRVADATRQQFTVQAISATGDSGDYAGEITAYDPGTFDPAMLKAGQRTVVSGRDAWYVPQYVFPGDGTAQRTAVLGWQDPSGTWLLAYADTAANENRVLDLDHLQRLGEQVVISPTHDLRAPFRLGWLPAGLVMTYLAATDKAGPGGGATVGLSAAGRKPSTAVSYSSVPKDLDVSISAAAPGKGWPVEKAQLGVATAIGGRPAWLKGSDLVVEERQCVVRVHATAKLPRADLERLAKELRVGDCSESDSWTAPAG